MNKLRNMIVIGLTMFSLNAFCEEDSSGKIKVPQIPTTDFTWEGTFRANGPTVDAPYITAPLTIRGKNQGHYFNVSMEQGGPTDRNVWVQNFIYKDTLYTITRKWHRELPPGIKDICFKSPGVSVDNLNGILKSAQFVGHEIVDNKAVNHFRSSCLSSVFFGLLKVDIFSDIYVPIGHSFPWTKWLQFGDGVGLDLHHDEWFIFDRYKDYADHIHLPRECRKNPVEVIQGPCSNLEF